VLRTLTVADAPAFADHIASDLARLSQFLPWPARTNTPAGAALWVGQYTDGVQGRLLVAGIERDAELLGGIVLFSYEPAMATVELGCWVVAAAEGSGAVREACVEGLRAARHEYAVERVVWHCDPENTRSGGLARRLGFQLEGVLRSSYVLRGIRRDTEVYSLVDSEIDEAIG
jgi:ribosomal-protein-serine acetyltransferase